MATMECAPTPNCVLMLAIPAVVSCALPMAVMAVQLVLRETSQKFTVPGVTAVAPETTDAVRVITEPDGSEPPAPLACKIVVVGELAYAETLVANPASKSRVAMIFDFLEGRRRGW